MKTLRDTQYLTRILRALYILIDIKLYHIKHLVALWIIVSATCFGYNDVIAAPYNQKYGVIKKDNMLRKTVGSNPNNLYRNRNNINIQSTVQPRSDGPATKITIKPRAKKSVADNFYIGLSALAESHFLKFNSSAINPNSASFTATMFGPEARFGYRFEFQDYNFVLDVELFGTYLFGKGTVAPLQLNVGKTINGVFTKIDFNDRTRGNRVPVDRTNEAITNIVGTLMSTIIDGASWINSIEATTGIRIRPGLYIDRKKNISLHINIGVKAAMTRYGLGLSELATQMMSAIPGGSELIGGSGMSLNTLTTDPYAMWARAAMIGLEIGGGVNFQVSNNLRFRIDVLYTIYFTGLTSKLVSDIYKSLPDPNNNLVSAAGTIIPININIPIPSTELGAGNKLVPITDTFTINTKVPYNDLSFQSLTFMAGIDFFPFSSI